MTTSISLVLGSGGARGMAHIGIIRWLEENGFCIKSIAGCSIGALVGGFHAAGKLDVVSAWFQRLDTFGMFKLVDFKGTGGLVSGELLMRRLKDLCGDHRIEDLPIKFTAVASDVKAEKEIWINKGSLLDAIRASISLPLFFTPHYLHGRFLIDGGVLNPVPIAPTFHDETELTIAVNLGGPLESRFDKDTDDYAPRTAHESTHPSKPANKLNSEPDSIDETSPDPGPLDKITPSPSPAEKLKELLPKFPVPDAVRFKDGVHTIADRSFDAMQSTIARLKLAAYPPDIEISIPRNLCGTLEFQRSSEIIEYGYRTCAEYFRSHPMDDK